MSMHCRVQARRIVGLDPNRFMQPLALQASAAAGLQEGQLQLVEGLAESMPFPDDSFDTVVCTLTLCSVESPERVLREMRRVLRPAGQLVFLEHVRDPNFGVLWLQQALFDPLQQALADGCHLTRDTAATILAEAWSSVELTSFRVDGASLISPHIRGVVAL
jgi:ubiquinone/menaquinone biosynthesis C-methylase UbiE